MTALAPFEAPDGLVVVVKRDCPTCTLIEPVLQRLAQSGARLTVFTQDDPSFPQKVPAVMDDRQLEASFRLKIEAVPTLLRVKNHAENTSTAIHGSARGTRERYTMCARRGMAARSSVRGPAQQVRRTRARLGSIVVPCWTSSSRTAPSSMAPALLRGARTSA